MNTTRARSLPIAATIAEDEHVAMVLDQAGWHGAKALRVPSNITFIPLPPYSPELNPVERVWLHLKERFLSHRLHAGYDAIAEAASRAWNRLVAETGGAVSVQLRLAGEDAPRKFSVREQAGKGQVGGPLMASRLTLQHVWPRQCQRLRKLRPMICRCTWLVPSQI